MAYQFFEVCGLVRLLSGDRFWFPYSRELRGRCLPLVVLGLQLSRMFFGFVEILFQILRGFAVTDHVFFTPLFCIYTGSNLPFA